MIKKVKCNVCNFRFFVESSKVKTVLDKNGLFSLAKYYDAVDCPKCGCQKILYPRLMEIDSGNAENDSGITGGKDEKI